MRRDPFDRPRPGEPRAKRLTALRRALLAVDSALDARVYESGRRALEAYEKFSARMARFKQTGWRKGAVDLACEGLNLACVAAVGLLALAIPAFEETSEDWLKKQDLAVTFLDRNGAEAGRRGIRHDDSVDLDQFPDHMIRAVLATEDRRFFDHWGIDPIGTARALAVNARNDGVVQGGSTLTQQLAKNLFLTNERSLQRKTKEAFLAFWLEGRLTKKEILKLYLDRAYMGAGNFGVQAAAEFYFGKSIRDVSLAEAAMLAGLFKAPTKYAPHINLPAARARASDVLDNLVAAGFMTQAQILPAQRHPATPVDRAREASPDWYLDFAYSEVRALADAGKLGSDRVLTVRTALDPLLQAHSENVVEQQLRQNGRAAHVGQAAAVVMEPQTGAVVALVGGRDYGLSQFNRATNALRQPGSSFKPYVYLTAIDSGKFTPSTIVVDRPLCLGNWCPRNYGGSFAGALPLSSALARSLNTVAVQLSISLGDPKRGAFQAATEGRGKIVETARKLGITTPMDVNSVSLPLGAEAVTPLEHSAAYAAFANGGKRVKAFAAIDIRNSHGVVIYRRDRDGVRPEQAVPERSIAMMNTMLVKVVEEGTGGRARLDGLTVGGKTGTTNGYKDAWFCGFTGNYNGCVWVGNDDTSPMRNITGGSLPAQTWHDIFAFAHRDAVPRALPGLPPPAGGEEKERARGETPGLLSPRAGEAIDGIENLLSQPFSGRRAEASPRAEGASENEGFVVVR